MPLDDREVTYGNSTFQIGKLLPQEAKQVFMTHVRPMLEGAASSEGGDGGIGMILGLVAKAPQAHYDAAMRALYTQITYTTPQQPQPMKLLGDEALAFMDLDMAHILLVDVRAFAVNFSGSWAVIQSEFPSLTAAFDRLTQATSTLSSTTP